MSQITQRLVLEFSIEQTTVFVCENDVPQECFGSIYADDAEFDLEIQRLARAARAEVSNKTPCEIWLTEDQMIVRHVRLNSTKDDERTAEAAGALSAITPYKVEDLSFTLGEEDAEGYTAIAAVQQKRLEEIVSLAQSIGMSPSRIVSTDALEGFDTQAEFGFGMKAVKSAGLRIAQVACFMTALVLPFILAGAANDPRLVGKVNSFLAFTPSFGTQNGMTPSPASPRPKVDVAAVQGVANDATPSAVDVVASKASVDLEFNALIASPKLGRTPRRGSLEFVMPEQDVQVVRKSSGPFLSHQMKPEPFAEQHKGADIPEPMDLGELLTDIEFKLAADDFAPDRADNAGGWSGTLVATLEMQFDISRQRPRLRPLLREQEMQAYAPPTPLSLPTPRRLLPKLRPLPPPPDEIYSENDLPNLALTPDRGVLLPETPAPMARVAIGPTPPGFESWMPQDVRGTLRLAALMRLKKAAEAADLTSLDSDAWHARPPKRNATPGPSGSGSLVQLDVASLDAMAQVVDAEKITPTLQPVEAFASRAATNALSIGLAADVNESIAQYRELRESRLRLAALNADGAAPDRLPRLRFGAVFPTELLQNTSPVSVEAEEAEPVVEAVAAAPLPAPEPATPDLSVAAATDTAAADVDLQTAETADDVAQAPVAAMTPASDQAAALAPLAELTRLPPPSRPERVVASIDPSVANGGGVRRPLLRPASLSEQADRILREREKAAALVATRQKPATTTPSTALNIPTNARVGRVATIADGINLADMSLIGIFGRSGSRHALIRTSQGRIEKVRNGQSVSGWTIAAIGDDGVRIQRRSKTRVLRLPN